MPGDACGGAVSRCEVGSPSRARDKKGVRKEGAGMAI